MQKIPALRHASKIIAMCLPPVLMALTGLAVLSRQPRSKTVAARKPPPSPRRGSGSRG